MVETTDEKGFVEDREATLKEVELKVNQNNPEQVDKVIFHTAGGKVTWKPKLDKTSYEGGFKIAKKVPMEKDMLPDLLKQMAMQCNEKGQVQIKLAYNYWKTEDDGEQQTYRYITSKKTFDEYWSIIPEVPQEENLI